MSLSAAEANKLKQAHADEPVLPVVLHRWSPRAFAEKTVSDADLKTIFEAVRWTASSSNEQPWRFIVGRQGTETHAKIFDSLVGSNQLWASKASVLILGGTRSKFLRNDNPNRFAQYDLGAAAITLALQAAALGLAAHQMGGFDAQKAQESL